MIPERLKFLNDTGSKEIRELVREIERLQAPQAIEHVAVPDAHEKSTERFRQLFHTVPLSQAEKLPDPDFGLQAPLPKDLERRLREVELNRALQVELTKEWKRKVIIAYDQGSTASSRLTAVASDKLGNEEMKGENK